MIDLLIVADDFTGALDTGVQFAKYGTAVQIYVAQNLTENPIPQETRVLVLDAETRHLPPGEAYRILKDIGRQAADMEVPVILKKTDSGLRGNIGAEIKGLLDAEISDRLFFLPSYPEVGRTMKKGCYFVNGLAVADSVFGEDPFEPVSESRVEKLLSVQCPYLISLFETGQPYYLEEEKGKRICLFDGETEEELLRRGQELEKKVKPKLYAGCAGFAKVLARLLPLERGEKGKIGEKGGMIVICGSLNLIAQRQVALARRMGVCEVTLKGEQKYNPVYYQKVEGKHFLESLGRVYGEEKLLIVDTFDSEEASENMLSEKLSMEERRLLVSSCLGEIARHFAEKEDEITFFMTGGDTLLSFMEYLGCKSLKPICEIAEGTVFSKLIWRDRELQVISKAGGLGEEDIIMKAAEKVIKNYEDKSVSKWHNVEIDKRITIG